MFLKINMLLGGNHTMIYGNDWIEKFQFEISAEKINKLIEACNSMPINESTILL